MKFRLTYTNNTDYQADEDIYLDTSKWGYIFEDGYITLCPATDEQEDCKAALDNHSLEYTEISE